MSKLVCVLELIDEHNTCEYVVFGVTVNTVAEMEIAASKIPQLRTHRIVPIAFGLNVTDAQELAKQLNTVGRQAMRPFLLKKVSSGIFGTIAGTELDAVAQLLALTNLVRLQTRASNLSIWMHV